MVDDDGMRARADAVLACGSLHAEITVTPAGITLRATYDGAPVPVVWRLGATVGGADLGHGSRLLGTSRRTVEGAWAARTGKAVGRRSYRHEELVLRLRHDDGLEWRLTLRVAADGLAVRYGVPDLQGLSHLEHDGTLWTLPADARAWVLDYQTWYETPRRGVDLPALAPGDLGLPFLARLGAAGTDLHLLVAESGIDGRYSGAHVVHDGEGAFGLGLADPTVEVARGDVTPWRVFLLGPLERVVESLLVDELAPAAAPELEAADWVRPGRAAWSWWSDFYSGAQLNHQRHVVDVAAELGWEHLLIDCGWDETWVPEIVAYASLRGIQVHLWAVWHDLDGPEKLRRLALWRSWGVAGIKVDFMESESKDRYRWYDTVLAETARLGLMVNFHGSVVPRGWSRTWPQVVGYEAVRGSEYYVFYDDTPLTAEHNVIQPFTRNVLGAMDYTPVAFSAPGRATSDGHELALAVVYESGITHFADSVDVYRSRPDAARLLAELPPAWDETVLLAGTPDTEAVVARRAGDRWFVGVVAAGPARTVRVPLDRLGLGAVRAWVVADGAGSAPGTGLRALDVRLGPGRPLEVPVAENGGFAAILVPADAEPFRARPRPVAEPPRVEPAVVPLDADGSAGLTVPPQAVLRLPPGWSAEPRGAGRWRVRADASLPAGALGVVTVEEPGEDPRVPRVAHARLVRPLTVGEHPLSALPFLAFRNESGPVERDLSNGGGNPRDGGRITVAGREHDHGLGVSAPSSVDVFVGGWADRFVAEVGIDDETPGTRAVARVRGDGAELAAVPLVAGEPARRVEVDLRGVRVLTLATEPIPAEPAPAGPAPAEPAPVGPTPAHVDWAGARVLVVDPHTHDLHTTGSSGHR